MHFFNNLGSSKQQVGKCCRLHASYSANVQKSDSQHVHFPFFFLPWCYVKLCEAVVKKCMYKIPSGLLQKLWLCDGDQRKQLILDLHHHRWRTNTVPFSCRFTFFWELQRSPSWLTLVCVKWIRPGNVFLTVSNHLSLSQLQARKTCAVFTKGLPLRTVTRLSSNLTDLQVRCHRLATNRQPFVKVCWTKSTKPNAESSVRYTGNITCHKLNFCLLIVKFKTNLAFNRAV